MTEAAANDNALKVLLAEYAELKAEQRRRISLRDYLIYFTFSVEAAVGYAAFQTNVPQILLAIPLACFVLGWKYLSNDIKTTALRRYFRDTVAPRLTQLTGYNAVLSWETGESTSRGRSHRKAIQLVADLTAFCLPPTVVIVVFINSTVTFGDRYGYITWTSLALAGIATTVLAWHFIAHTVTELPSPAAILARLLPRRGANR